MRRYERIGDYLGDLKKELKSVDEAIASDALDDAEEHLNLMVGEILNDSRAKTREKAVALAVKEYGSPNEIAKAYFEMDDEYQTKREIKKKKAANRGILRDIFGVYASGRTYLGLIYLFLMFPIGIIYFTYMVTMISVTAALLIFIFGILIGALFLMSNYALSWIHGRFTELMLGIRMPKKPRRLKAKGNWKQRIKGLFADPRMYTSLLYMFLMFPLGVIYFTILVTMLALSFALLMTPFTAALHELTGIPIGLPAPPEARLVMSTLGFLLGFVMLTWTLHLSNILCFIHGKLTKALLVRR